MYLKPPYLKPRGFCPNPIAKFGIPQYADSSRNKKVIGTLAHQQWWEQELDYIINGYTTGGMWIPGDYYFFLNYRVLPTVMGPIRPDVCDLHLELAFMIEEAKRIRWNIICPKGRRKGLSEFTQTVIDRGWRFTPGFHAGVAAGHDKYIQDFMDKWRYADANIPKELQIKKDLGDNKGEVKAGYFEKNDEGAFIQSGTENMIYMRTMGASANLFKGLYLNYIIGEEGGEFKNIKEFSSASNECVMHGDIQFGMKIFYGTGGRMSKESKQFKELYYEAESLRFMKLIVPGTRFYFPCYSGATEIQGIGPAIPNLISLKDYHDETFLGVEDLKEAEKRILARRAHLLKSGDIEGFHKFCQEVPLNEKEIFRNTVSNNFDAEKLSDKLIDIDVKGKKYIKYKPRWKKNNKGEYVTPLVCEMIVAGQLDKDEDCVLIHVNGHPRPNTVALFAGGVDSYDKDQSKTSKSLGAMCVRVRDNNIQGMPKKIPVAIIRCRPKRKERFYEMCCMTSVYFGLHKATLIDVANGVIFEHYKNLGLSRYLAPRPKKFESEGSEQMHEFGISMNGFSKPRMVSLMQSDVYDHAHEYEFPILIEELQNYDELEIGSDNDLADAHGFSLIQDAAMNMPATEDNTEEIEDPWAETQWGTDARGHSIIIEKGTRILSQEQDRPSFGQH